MRERCIRRTIGVATVLAAAAFISPPVSAQLPPLSPAAGFCPAPAPRGGGGRGRAGGGGQPAADPTPAFPGPVFDQAMGSGENYAVAEFRLWYPQEIETIRAVLVLTPGSNGDGRNQVMDETWEAFAVEHGLALVGREAQGRATRDLRAVRRRRTREWRCIPGRDDELRRGIRSP